MMLQVDGSTKDWLGGDEQQDLVEILDDDTTEVYNAKLVEQESKATVMAGLKEVNEQKGMFCSMYSERGRDFLYTKTAGGAKERGRQKKKRREMQQLGKELKKAKTKKERGK